MQARYTKYKSFDEPFIRERWTQSVDPGSRPISRRTLEDAARAPVLHVLRETQEVIGGRTALWRASAPTAPCSGNSSLIVGRRRTGEERTRAKNTVAELLVETLAGAGVARMYGVSGDSLNGITDAIRRHEHLRWVHVRHEEAAAFAAGAGAHLTGRLAVCAGCSVPSPRRTHGPLR